MVAATRLLPLLCVTALVIASATASPMEREKRSLKHFFSRLFSEDDEKEETEDYKSKEDDKDDKDDKEKHHHLKHKLKEFAHKLKSKLKYKPSEYEEKKKTEEHHVEKVKEAGKISESGSHETKEIHDENTKDVDLAKSAAAAESDIRKKRLVDDKVTTEHPEDITKETTLANDQITIEHSKDHQDEPVPADGKDSYLGDKFKADSSKRKEFKTDAKTEDDMLIGQKSDIGYDPSKDSKDNVKDEMLDERAQAPFKPQLQSKGKIDDGSNTGKHPDDIDKMTYVGVQRKKVYYDEPESDLRKNGESAIDSLVYGHVPDQKPKAAKADLKADGSEEDDIEDKGSVEKNEDESGEKPYDGENTGPQIPVDGLDISGLPYLIAVRRAIALLFPELDNVMIEVRPVYVPTTVFEADEDEAETQKKETKILSEVKKEDHKELEKEEKAEEKKMKLEFPHAIAGKHSWGVFYPWMTVKEIFWKIEEDIIEERQKAAEEAGIVLPVEFKDEVISIAGKKFLLKTKIVKSGPEEKEQEFVSVVSIRPFFEDEKEVRTEFEAEGRFRPPFLSSKEEPEEPLEKEYVIEKKADLVEKVKDILKGAADLEWTEVKKADEK